MIGRVLPASTFRAEGGAEGLRTRTSFLTHVKESLSVQWRLSRIAYRPAQPNAQLEVEVQELDYNEIRASTNRILDFSNLLVGNSFNLTIAIRGRFQKIRYPIRSSSCLNRYKDTINIVHQVRPRVKA